MPILKRYYTIIILFQPLFALPGREREGETTTSSVTLVWSPHFEECWASVLLGTRYEFLLQNFIQHFPFKKIVGGCFFGVKFMKHFSYLLLFAHLKFKQVLGDSCLLWRTSNLGLFYFISFSIGLDSNSTKKIGTKIWFWSGSWKETKETQVLVMKIRPSFKD